MAEGSKGRRKRLEYQMRKFLKLFPEERIKREKREIAPTGAEALDVLLVKKETGGSRAVKVYRTGFNRITNREITPEEMIARFKFQKELYSKGYPVARPVRILFDKKKRQIIWEEELIGNGLTYYDAMRLAKEGKLEGMTPEDVQRECARTLQEIRDAIKEEGGELSYSDAYERNLIWDPEKRRFIVVDLGTYKKGYYKKKEKKKKRG